MTAEEPKAPGPGLGSYVATTVIVTLAAFTVVLVTLAFPAGVYAVFHGGLSAQLGYASQVPSFLWLGPIPAVFPFNVPVGGLFLLLTVIYAGLFLVALNQPKHPLQAIREAASTGVGGLTGSPFMVVLISVGFLNFTAVIISALSQAAAGPVGNPFSGTDPLLEFGSLTFAPLREEFGFRLLLIGLVAFVLSIGRTPREALRSLWRPSAAYEGALVGGATSMIIWIATAASAATFGVCHVSCGGGGGWNWSKLPEATWGGIVLGYLYVRYGFHVAVLAHWGVDYLGSVYTFFGQSAFGIPAGSTSSVYVGQYLVDLDMTLLFGAACFILVVYLGVRKFAEGRRRDEVGFVDKGLGPGGGLV